jgi:hypothetical protein
LEKEGKNEGKDKKKGKLEQKVDSLQAIFEKEFKVTKKKKDEKSPKKKNSLEEETKNKKIKDHKTITYSSQEERFLAENFYKSNIDYDNLFSYTFSGIKANSQEDFYEDEAFASSDTHSETMSTEEAKEMLVSVQYAQVLGSMTELNHEKRRQFTNWVAFNKDLMGLFHTLYSVTGDVDYNKTF